jgi:hypothetical protein
LGSYASKNTVGWLIDVIKDRFVKKADFDTFYNDDYVANRDAFYSEEFVPLTEQVSNIGHGIGTAGDGAAYLADVPGIDSLEVGSWFIMIPNVDSTVDVPTLNINNLGAKDLTSGVREDIPVLVIYDGQNWRVSHTTLDADNLLGVVSIEQGGTGAETAEEACENLGVVKKTGDVMTGNLEFQGTDAKVKVNTEGNVTVCPKYEYDTEYNAYHVRKPEDNEFVGSIRTIVSEENNARKVGLYTLSKNSSYANRVMIGVDDEGNRTVDVGLAATAWRDAINAAKAVDSGSAVTTNTYFKYYLKNGMCTLYGASTAKMISSDGTSLGTLPTAARPKMNVEGSLSLTTNNCGQFRITTAGVVTLYAFNSTGSQHWNFTVTYPVA